jgi:hypothetical protein
MKRLIAKMAVLLFIAALCQATLTMLTGAPEEVKEIDQYLKNKVDIIYFGDSTVRHVAANDLDRRSIAAMLQDQAPHLKIGVISQGSLNLDAYVAYYRYIVTQKNLPSAFIMCINMRSFSPEWDRRPQYQFGRLKAFLGDNPLVKVLYGPLSVFKYNFYGISQNEFENTAVFNGNIAAGSVREYDWSLRGNYSENREEKIKKLYVFLYMYSLKEQHRKLNSMLDIAQTAKRYGIRVIFYISPIDYETAEIFYPSQFVERLKFNTNIIDSVLSREGYDVLNLSMGLKADSFDYRIPNINEHMNEKGRNYVAEELASALNRNQ